MNDVRFVPDLMYLIVDDPCYDNDDTVVPELESPISSDTESEDSEDAVYAEGMREYLV